MVLAEDKIPLVRRLHVEPFAFADWEIIVRQTKWVVYG